MNHRHRKILHAIFAHPFNANLSFRDIEHVLVELGAEVENKSGNRVNVTLNGRTAVLRHAGHSLGRDDVAQIRKFLESCGISPAGFPV